MANGNDVPHESVTPEPETKADPRGNDWFLQYLASMANQLGLQVAITLQMSGFLVSGTTMRDQDYFERLATEFSERFADQVAKEYHRKTLLDIVDVIKEKNADKPDLLPMFIHLKDARFFQVGGLPIPREPTLWRGKISDVSGFFFGELRSDGK